MGQKVKRSENLPEVSVIVPHYDMEKSLQNLVLALNKTTYPKHLLEVFIVDNGSSKAPRIPKSTLNLMSMREPRPGSYAARNTALEAASGPVIAFTDADCLPEPEWLMAGVTCLLQGAERIAGNIELVRRSTIGSGTYLYQKAFTFDVQADLETKGHVATANMFTWKRVFDEVGHFNESAFSGGDKEWSLRCQQRGFKTGSCPKATVLHPARSFTELVRHRKRLAGGVGVASARGDRRNFLEREFFRDRTEAIRRVISSSDKVWTKFSAFVVGLILYCVQLFWTVWFATFPNLQPPRS